MSIPRTRAALVVVVGTALVGVLGYRSLSVSASPPTTTTTTSATAAQISRPPRADAPGDLDAVAGNADGVVPDGVTVFDDAYPAVTNLERELRRALREAAAAAADEGVELFVESGWRSPKYQEQLLAEAIVKYGSKEEAARWVATPETSAHVSGRAVDIGPAEATAWLSEHGVAYGLCRIYGNEPWHFELRVVATGRGCPPPYADPTQDPRMQ